jgi:hypothetical protein
MLFAAIKKSVDALIEASNYAVLIKRIVDIAPTDKNLSERKDLKKQLREIEEAYGWKPNFVNSYAKVGEQLPENIANLRLLDFDTLKSLCREKFQPILERLEGEPLTIVEVREEMAEINKALKKPKEPPKQLEWQQSKWGENGDRRLVIRLEDADTGVAFEKQYEQSGEISVAIFIREMLQRPTATEQSAAMAAQPVAIFEALIQPTEVIVITEQSSFFDSPALSDEAEIELQSRLLDRYQKIDVEIDRLLKDGYDESSYPLSNARSQLKEVILELRSLGIESELAE